MTLPLPPPSVPRRDIIIYSPDALAVAWETLARSAPRRVRRRSGASGSGRQKLQGKRRRKRKGRKNGPRNAPDEIRRGRSGRRAGGPRMQEGGEATG